MARVKFTAVCLAVYALVVLALAITPAPADAQLQLLAQLGIAVQLQSAVQSVIQIAGAGGLALAVTPSAPCSLTISSISSLAGLLGGASSLPAGCTQLNFGGGGLLGLGNALGYQIAVSPASVALNAATLLTGVVQNAGAITASSPCGCVTPVAGGGYAAVQGVVYSAASGVASIPISATACQASGYATYIPVAIQSQVQSQLGAAVAIVGNSQQTINYGTQIGSQVALQFQSAAENTVTCTQSSVATGAGAAASAIIGAGTAVGQYTQFQMQSCTSQAYIHTTYTAQQLAAAGVCNANNLRLAVFNSACNCYRVPTSGGSVNTGTGVVTQYVTTASSSIPQCALVEAPYSLGQSVAVQAAQQARITYTSGAQFAAQTAGSAQVTVQAVTSVAAAGSTPLPSGCVPMQFTGPSGCTSCAGSGVGYTVASSGSAVSNSYVQTAPVTPACAQQIQQTQNNGGSLECHHYNSAGQYQGSYPATYDHNTGCVHSSVPSCQGDRYVYACRN